ncbi:MAG: hypothetical protein LBF22_03835 [Deltaproteobacteria bacterium]|jgi:malate/lactate dehydrogenase|nr:hypothetical protein [Deltaproteobacteria bacterium]
MTVLKNSKCTIVGGAGGLGSTMAFYIGLKNMFDTIVLLDKKENVLATHHIDLRECFIGETATQIKTGSWKEAEGSDVVIMTAASTGHQVASRNEYLSANLGLIKDTAKNIREYAPDSIVVVATAPTDVYVMIFLEELGFERNRVVGYSHNDSQRFRWALGQVLNTDPVRLEGLVVGEHGESQVPLFSTARLDGKVLALTHEDKAKVKKILDDWYPSWQAKDAGRTTTWSTAVGMWRTLLGLTGGIFKGPLTGSVLATGEYGIHNVAVGLPLAPGPRGFTSVVELPLEESELEALRASAVKVKELHEESTHIS